MTYYIVTIMTPSGTIIRTETFRSKALALDYISIVRPPYRAELTEHES